MPVRSLQHADLSPKAATDVGNRLVELAAQAKEGQVIRVHIVVGGRGGGTTWTIASRPSYAKRSKISRQHSGLGQCSGMTPEARVETEPWSSDSGCMKISDKIKSLFQRRPRTADELAARAEAQSELEQIRVDARNNQPSP